MRMVVTEEVVVNEKRVSMGDGRGKQAEYIAHSQTFTTWGLRQNRCLSPEMKDIFCLFVAMVSSKAFPEALKYEKETQFLV